MRSNILDYAFIDGREVSLESHQTKLWRRYLQKIRNDEIDFHACAYIMNK